MKVRKEHFATLGQSKTIPTFDNDHFEDVSAFVFHFNMAGVMDDNLFNDEVTLYELRDAVRTLNKGKSPGFDKITAEQVVL